MAEFQDETIFTAIAGLASTFMAWLFGRRKENANVTKTEIENLEQAVKLWRETAEGLHKEQERQREQNDKLMRDHQHQINNLRTQINGLYEEIKDLRNENNKLRQALHKAGIDYDSLYEAD